MRPGKGIQRKRNHSNGKVYVYHGILCPECGAPASRVKDTRMANDRIRRRRVCAEGHCFTTWELAETIVGYDFQI